MLKQGGVGFLGATKVAYGMPGWNDPMDGSSQSMDYFFTTACTSGRRLMAWASSSVSFCVVPPNMPGMPPVSTLPGLIARMFVPNWVIAGSAPKS